MVRGTSLELHGGLLPRAAVLLLALSAAACQGPAGPAGPSGAVGPAGSNGVNGVDGTTGPGGNNGVDGVTGATGATGPQGQQGATGPSGSAPPSGLAVGLAVSAPANGQFFTAGEQPVATFGFSNSAGPLAVDQLSIARLYAYGPRLGAQTRTASSLLNCVTDRDAGDGQHHFIDLLAPSFADPAQANLVPADGGWTFTFAPVGLEDPGTYTVAIWAVSADGVTQVFQLADFQIGTAQAEAYASGPVATATCEACHYGPTSGKSYFAHAAYVSAALPQGAWSLDSAPIGSCKACHNQDGYSPNPLVEKVHGVHRGEHLTHAGEGHPEYALAADPSLASFTDVEFPAMPEHEKDCATCHADDRWKQNPTRQSCGTCHDNVFFDTGVVSPVRDFGQPSTGACTQDFQCGSFGNLAVCNTATGRCELQSHPRQADDADCATCHTADPSGLVPVAGSHEILSRTQASGLQLLDAALSGASGDGGQFLAGDAPTLTFRLLWGDGGVVSDLATNTALSAAVVVGGPTDDRQRIAGPFTLKTQGTLSFDASSGSYTYVFPSALPSAPLAPWNTSAPVRVSNPAGTYTAWVYATDKQTFNGVSTTTDSANAVLDFAFGAAAPVRPRQAIDPAACNKCHVQLQAHGGSRRSPQSCSLCHTRGAEDRGVGAQGLSCTADTDCPGHAAGWEACQDSSGAACSGSGCLCTITADPTPGQTIDFRAMIHAIHYGRLRDGFMEQGNLINPGELTIVGYRNSANDFSDDLFPQDVRNCQLCHADTAASCSAANPCGSGQECQNGSCVNVAWQKPSGTACLACHDSASAYAHAQLNTWTNPSTSQVVESCDVCHDRDGIVAVAKVHAITGPYVPPYPREKAE